MDYPTIEQVEAANQKQLCQWHRFLPSPGSAVLAKEDFIPISDKQEEFEEILKREVKIMDRIEERFKEVGGFTPELSKEIGWEP